MEEKSLQENRRCSERKFAINEGSRGQVLFYWDTRQSGATYATRSSSSRQTNASGVERTNDGPSIASLSNARLGNLSMEMGKTVGKCCGWKHPRASSVSLLFDSERATRAVLSFLRDTNGWADGGYPPRPPEEAAQQRRAAIAPLPLHKLPSVPPPGQKDAQGPPRDDRMEAGWLLDNLKLQCMDLWLCRPDGQFRGSVPVLCLFMV